MQMAEYKTHEEYLAKAEKLRQQFETAMAMTAWAVVADDMAKAREQGARMEELMKEREVNSFEWAAAREQGDK